MQPHLKIRSGVVPPEEARWLQGQRRAFTMSSLPKDQKGFAVCKAAWGTVEGIILGVNELQRLPG